jgi:uncharacterized YkwD family protein
MKKIILTICLLSLLITLGACSNQNLMKAKESSIFDIAEVRNGIITEEYLNVKSGAGNSFNTITSLKKNEEFNVVGQIENWYVIKMDNNEVGCIDSSRTRPIVKDNIETQVPGQDTEIQNTIEPPVEPSADLNNLERNMLNLVNNERSKNNLPLLKNDPELTRIARIKAQDMVDNNYFSHYSPTYGSPFDMMDAFNIEYLYAGENIAANSSVNQAHNALMNSSGHRKNILSPNFTHIGIGIKPGKTYPYIIVEMFIGK